MGFPKPVPGLVIRYAYLWHTDFLKGREEGVKDRPCAVILVTQDADGAEIVTVLPVTHAPPDNPALALEIPANTKARLGLDSERSWVILSEANQFAWPGPDLRLSIRGDAASVAYGLLPAQFYEHLRAKFIAALKERKPRITGRDTP